VNDLVVALVLAPFLLAVLYPRVARARLLYRDLLGPRPARAPWRTALGVALVVGATIGGFVAGQAISTRTWLAPWAPWDTPQLQAAVGVGLLPVLALLVAGFALL